MEALVYFGRYTIDLDSWVDQSLIFPNLKNLSTLMQEINACSYAKVKVPHDWLDEPDPFFEKTEAVLNNDSILFGQVYAEIYNEAFMASTFNKRGYLEAAKDIKNRNPNEDGTEYYGALKLGETWPDVPNNLHVSSTAELHAIALKFLIEHPLDEGCYLERCRKIFPNLVFAGDLEARLKSHGKTSKDGVIKGKRSRYSPARVTGINGFSKEVTKAFDVLNLVSTKEGTPKEVMQRVTEISGYECTYEGGDKDHLQFKMDDGKMLNCEYHIKIHNDNTRDGVRYEERVYFGFVGADTSRQIYIAHSGKHL